MKYVEVIANDSSFETIAIIAGKVKASDFRVSMPGADGMQSIRLLVSDHQVQKLLDLLENVLGAQPTARIIVLPVEVALPRPDEQIEAKDDSALSLRESLYQAVAKGSRLDANYLLLLVLSTIVAAIGLLEDNVAVVIGAMVIAPLLTPNLALSLGTALGDVKLMKKSAAALFVGIFIAISLSVVIGLLWSGPMDSPELMARTVAGLDAVALALASGAAAALSMTSGVSSVLVGVMVAVALLPPASTVGLMIGQGEFKLALGAALLLAINIVCVNLASKVLFFIKDIRPRKLFDKEKARQAMRVYIMAWMVTLTILVVATFSL